MPKTPAALQRHAICLQFEPGSLAHLNLSGVAFSGRWMWVVGDESAAVERLHLQPPARGQALQFAQATTFRLADLIDLPAGPDDEADLEGIAIEDGWLWLAGSHGLKRKNAKDDRDDADNARRLSRLALDGNRRLLARIPLETGADGAPRLVRTAADGRRAQRLKGNASRNLLTDLLAADPHLGPFLPIPGKDNGFDIEGLAVDGSRLLLGLRGPVLRGWAMVLELAVEPHGTTLRLAPLDATGTRLRKHFLQLGGLGVRDLHFDGDDLWVLAGPTMVLDGDIRLFRWAGARQALARNTADVRFERDFAPPVDLPHTPGGDRAEAFCALPDELAASPAWVVLYDAPGAARQPTAHAVLADLLTR